MARLAYTTRAKSSFGCRTAALRGQHTQVKSAVSGTSPDCAAGRLESARRLRSGRCLRGGTLGEADDLSASAVLTAHRLAQHGLGIVMVSGGQLILDSPNFGDDGVAHRRFLSCHSCCPSSLSSWRLFHFSCRAEHSTVEASACELGAQLVSGRMLRSRYTSGLSMTRGGEEHSGMKGLILRTADLV